MSDPVNESGQKKCPRCGSLMKPDKPCEKCGHGEGIEVEFKNFKISELLDIKMPPVRKKDDDSGEEKK